MSFTKHLDCKILLFTLTLFLGFSFIYPLNQINAQRREHLTKEEIEIVRDVQEIDKRMLVFSKAIERRFVVLYGADKLSENQRKSLENEKKHWGELPKGTQTQLLSDIDKIIEEAISKIEDVSDRDAESNLFPVAVHVLADNAKLYIPRLEKFGDANENRREIAVINSALQNCKGIIEASAKVSRPNEKFMKKRTKKIGHTGFPLEDFLQR